MAIATCPTRTALESPSVAHASGGPNETPMRITARSVSASRPTRSARSERPSGSRTLRRPAPSTTWLFVSTSPSGVKTTPDPPPRFSSTRTTDGPTASTAWTTAREYASSSSSSSDCRASRRGASAFMFSVYERAAASTLHERAGIVAAVISFVVPAYNEERLLGRTLASIHASARELARPYELIVVDDASTDQTAAIAEAAGARVVRGAWRQIACVRNAGARGSVGDVLIFVDADTVVSTAAVRATISAVES